MISLYLEDQMEDSMANAEWPEVELGCDISSTDNADYFVAMHNLPTEQELLEMEADQDESFLDDRLLRRERRTALRH